MTIAVTSIIVMTIIPRPSAIAFSIKPILPPTYIYTTHVVDDLCSGGVRQTYRRSCGCGRGEACQQQASCRAEHHSPERHISLLYRTTRRSEQTLTAQLRSTMTRMVRCTGSGFRRPAAARVSPVDTRVAARLISVMRLRHVTRSSHGSLV